MTVCEALTQVEIGSLLGKVQLRPELVKAKLASTRLRVVVEESRLGHSEISGGKEIGAWPPELEEEHRSMAASMPMTKRSEKILPTL
jgi:hypothetical protein